MEIAQRTTQKIGWLFFSLVCGHLN